MSFFGVINIHHSLATYKRNSSFGQYDFRRSIYFYGATEVVCQLVKNQILSLNT